MAGIETIDADFVPFLAWLLRTSASAAGIAAAVFVVQVASGRWLTPAWRYRLWGLLVLRLLLPVLPASPTSVRNLDGMLPVAKLSAWTARTPPANVPAAPAAAQGSSAADWRTQVIVSAVAEPPQKLRSTIPQGTKEHPVTLEPGRVAPVATGDSPWRVGPKARIPLVLAAIWLTGAALLFARLIVANVSLGRRLARATPLHDPNVLVLLEECRRVMRVSRAPALLVTDAVRAPAAAGVWRPQILLPPGLLRTLSRAEQRTVLLHELAHVRCRDVALNWLLAALQIMHWFNPILWWALARLRTDREAARDAMVLRLTSPGDETGACRDYVQTLLKLTEYVSTRRAPALATATVAGMVPQPRSAFLSGMLGGRRSLQRRFTMIDRFESRSRQIALLGPLAILVLSSVLLTDAKGAGDQTPKANPTAAATQPAQPKAKVSELIKTTQRLTNDGKFSEALATVRQILTIDPNNDYAVGIEPLLADKVQFAADRQQNEQRDVLRIPTDRPLETTKINAAEGQRATGRPVAATQKAADQQAAVLAQLDRQLPALKFDAMGFSDVVDFLRDVSGANIFVNWKALAVARIDRNTPVSARLRNVRFSKALSIILDSVGGGQRKLGYVVEEGVITISTADDLSKNVIVRVYDIRDLIAPVVDFIRVYDIRDLIAPVVDFIAAEPTKPTSTRATKAPSRQDMVTAITRLIMDTVDTASWKDRGGAVAAMREIEGQLIVTQTSENHRLIVTLLEQLREEQQLQVYVEARLVSCDREVLKGLLAQWAKLATTRPVSMNRTTTEPGTTATGIFLNDSQVEQFLRESRKEADAVTITAPRVTLFSGQRAYVRITTRRTYIHDYVMSRSPAGETRYEPVPDNFEAGILFDLRATVSADRQWVTLALRPKVSVLLGITQTPWPSRPAGSNLTVGEPRTRVSELRTAASIPDHATLLLSGLEDPGIPSTAATQPATPANHREREIFLLVKPRIVVRDVKEQKQFPLLNPNR